MAMVVSGAQIRAARALIHMDGKALAERAGVAISTIRRIETDVHKPSSAVGQVIRAALENAGVEFIEGGVRLKQS